MNPIPEDEDLDYVPPMIWFLPFDREAFENEYIKFVICIKNDDAQFVLQEVKKMLYSLEEFELETDSALHEISIATREWWAQDTVGPIYQDRIPIEILRREYRGALQLLQHAVKVYSSTHPSEIRDLNSQVGLDVSGLYLSWRCGIYMRKYWFVEPKIGMPRTLYRLLQSGSRTLVSDAPFSILSRFNSTNVPVGYPREIFEKWQIIQPVGAEYLLQRLRVGRENLSVLTGGSDLHLSPDDEIDYASLYSLFSKVKEGQWSVFLCRL